MDAAIKNIQTDITILTPKDIMQIYGLSRPAVKKILDKKGCPLLTGGRDSQRRNTGEHYQTHIISPLKQFLQGVVVGSVHEIRIQCFGAHIRRASRAENKGVI